MPLKAHRDSGVIGLCLPPRDGDMQGSPLIAYRSCRHELLNDMCFKFDMPSVLAVPLYTVLLFWIMLDVKSAR